MTRYVIFGLLAPLTIVADQLSKIWARDELGGGEIKTFIDGFWYWRLSFNRGSAFGLFNSESMAKWAPILLSAVGVIACIAILVMLVRASDRQRWLASALALVFGGAVGNVIDRIQAGKVTDFVVWQLGSFEWPAFNVADAALVAGVVILFFDLGKEQKKA